MINNPPNNLVKSIITYQKILVKGYDSREQVPLLHHKAWCLLKKSLILGQKIGLVPYSLKTDIVKNKYGKPYFTYQPNLYFNLSHTRGCVACIISKTEVGIDIETIRPYKKSIIQKVCTPLEQNWIKQSHYPDEAFFKIWTLKESLVKAEGTGIIQSLKYFEFQPDVKGKLQLAHSNLKYSFNQIIIEDKFVLSTCRKQKGDIKTNENFSRFN